MALIHDAQRWIYHHPSDHPLDGIEIPEPAVFTDEVVAVPRRCGRDKARIPPRYQKAPSYACDITHLAGVAECRDADDLGAWLRSADWAVFDARL
jgi:hypothetical protein